MIRRVFELDPLLCPCRGSFRVVAFIAEPRIVRKILHHLHANANRNCRDAHSLRGYERLVFNVPPGVERGDFVTAHTSDGRAVRVRVFIH